MFRDRTEAGERLADAIVALAPAKPVVLALPRGGVPVAVPVARRLGAPLDLILVRKIGVPGHEELAAGAVVDGTPLRTVWNRDVLRMMGLTEDGLDATVRRESAEIASRRERWLSGHPSPQLTGRTAIVVDDGVATGATVRAALAALADSGAARVILALPVAPRDTLESLRELADDVVCLEAPERFVAVGAHYGIFDQVPDAEVARILATEREVPDAGGKDP